MIPEGSIVSVLLDCHQLDGIVARADYPWENLVSELAVLGNTPMYTRHPDVCLIDPQAAWLTLDSFVFECVLRLWAPKHSIKKVEVQPTIIASSSILS